MSYLDPKFQDANLFYNNENARVRAQVAQTLPTANPNVTDLIAAHVNAAQRAGAPMTPQTAQQIATTVQREYRQQQAANEAAHRAQTRRYDLP